MMKTEPARLRREREAITSPLGLLRLDMRMTRAELAERSGVGIGTIRRYETGRRGYGHMSTQSVIRLSVAFGITVTAFLRLAQSNI
jgi:transcriptional regulator with XRE-family HTH domain